MLKKIIAIFLGVLILFAVVGLAARIAKISPFLFQLLFNKEVSLKKTDDHINILLLGIGGGEHDGPNLTDTIIFASLNPSKNKINLVSIPRDLWIKEIDGRINTAYAIGDLKRKNGGITLASTIVSKILNQKIDYVVRTDFNGFTKAINLIDGIDVNIQRTFDDYEYPLDGKGNDLCGHTEEELPLLLATASSQLIAFPCRYTHIHSDRGLQHLDGEKALQIVRSRHAEGEEGTDFARSQRQEAVIKAIKDKILSVQTLLNLPKVISLYDLLQESIDTNINENEFDDFIRLAQKMKNAKISSVVLDYGDPEKGRAGLLINPPITKDYNNQWVLIPRIGDGNFSEIQQYVSCDINIGACIISKTPSSN